MVDYQERPEIAHAQRWLDRLVPDGSWSGNVYDFFRRVYAKLTADLKVPFQLQEGQRIEDTPVHEALREALVNTLVHADFSGRVAVLVVKQADLFAFRNPGCMRIPLDLAIQGGHSDCRNRRLQTMFQLVGYGDHAGSGLPKIYRNWASQHWRRPMLHELQEPEQTLMELRMSSLLPEQAVAELEARLGGRFRVLDETSRLALVTAQVEGLVSHDRLKLVCIDHPADLTKKLRALVRNGHLVPDGAGRGMVYYLPWQWAERVAADFEVLAIPPDAAPKSPELDAKSPELSLWLEWTSVPQELQQTLKTLAEPVTQRKHARAELLRGCILQLCQGRFLGLRVLAHLLERDPDDLRKRTLKPLVVDGALRTAYPSMRDPRQAYTVATGHSADSGQSG